MRAKCDAMLTAVVETCECSGVIRVSSRADAAADLADQVRGLSITAVCRCGDDFCSSFYTGPRPDGPWGQTHRNVSPEVAAGMIVLDVVDDQIRYVEVLDRADVKSIIATLAD